MTSALSAWIWSERFWLPENVSWADLEQPPPGVQYPRLGHLLLALPLAVGVFLLRLLYERYIKTEKRLVAKPCAHLLRIQAEGPRQAQPNDVLEKVYRSTTCPDRRQLEGLSKQLDWEVRRTHRWFRLRRNQDRPSLQKKFCESMWRFTFYLGIFLYAISDLWASPWMWEVRRCWHQYPFQHVSRGQFNYYMAELAFYCALMFSQFTDVQRKDFIIMLVHHLATILLITFSYTNNMIRCGTLVMCLHDASDIFLEAAKLANYAKYQRLCDGLFVAFGLIFFLTRLVLYPFWVVYTVLFDSWEIIGPYGAWWLLNGLLLLLQALHVIWFYLIARIAVKAIFKGKVSKDDRSDIETSSDEDVSSSSSSSKNSNQAWRGKDVGPTAALNGGAQDH